MPRKLATLRFSIFIYLHSSGTNDRFKRGSHHRIQRRRAKFCRKLYYQNGRRVSWNWRRVERLSEAGKRWPNAAAAKPSSGRWGEVSWFSMAIDSRVALSAWTLFRECTGPGIVAQAAAA